MQEQPLAIIFGRNMGLKKNKIINIQLQNNYKTCCYGVTTVGVYGDLWEGATNFCVEAIK